MQRMRFIAASSHRRQNLKYKNFTPSFARLRQNNTKKRNAHAARLFFHIQPIKTLLCGAVVAVPVGKS